jgi:hypothetical protein
MEDGENAFIMLTGKATGKVVVLSILILHYNILY